MRPAPLRAVRRRKSSPRRGAAAVEFAIVASLFFALIFGIIEFGRLMMVQQVLTNASREGARRAIIENSTEAEVREVIESYLGDAAVSGSTATVEPQTLSMLSFGDPVTVTISVPYESVSWIPSPWFLDGITMRAATTMRCERAQ